MDIFRDDEDRRQYLQFIKEEAGRSEIEILAWCLMSNHGDIVKCCGLGTVPSGSFLCRFL